MVDTIRNGPDNPAAAAPAGAWPLLGHAPALLRDPLGFLGRAYGCGPVVRIRLGRAPAHLVNDAAAIRRILVADAAGYDKGFQFDKLRVLIGDGVGTSTGARHRRQRALMRPAFDHGRVAGYLAEMSRSTVAEVDAWPPGTGIEAGAVLRRLTMTIVCRSMFGSDSPAGAEVLRSLPALLGGVGLRALLPFDLLERLPVPANRRFDQARARLHAAVDLVIGEHRAHQAAGGYGDDLLAMLLASVDEDDGSGMTDAQAHDEVMTILLAGTETAAGALAWALHLVSRDPALQAAVQAEVDAVEPSVRRPAGVTAAHLAQLSLLRRVLTEALRLYPPGWVLGRRPVRDTELAGVRVDAGTQLLLNFYGLHRDPGVFPDPDLFAPDRWSPGDRRAADPELVRTHYLPFGVGSRGCVGEAFAWSEMLVVLTVVFSRFTVRPVPGSVVTPVARTTLHPRVLPLTLEPRPE